MDTAGDADPTAIDISADDYARAAATDQATPSAADRNARTHQTEETFQAEKATYVAKQDNGNVGKIPITKDAYPARKRAQDLLHELALTD